jgi:hypothetical protein
MLDRLVEEAFLSGFDLEHFRALPGYKERMTYAKETGLPRLGCGVAKCTYALSPEKVIKIAKDAEQNSKEFSAFKKFGPKYAPAIYDHDEYFTWMISEHATTWQSAEQFEADTGLNETWLESAFHFLLTHPEVTPENLSREFNKVKSWEVPDVSPTKLGKILIAKMAHLARGGMDDVTHWAHWGITAGGRLVCVDLGMTHEY